MEVLIGDQDIGDNNWETINRISCKNFILNNTIFVLCTLIFRALSYYYLKLSIENTFLLVYYLKQ